MVPPSPVDANHLILDEAKEKGVLGESLSLSWEVFRGAEPAKQFLGDTYTQSANVAWELLEKKSDARQEGPVSPDLKTTI